MFHLFLWFFVSSWLIVWTDEIKGCGWCLAGGRRGWFKGLHQIPSATWIFHHFLHIHITYTDSFVLRIKWSLCCCFKWLEGWGWLIYVRVLVGKQGMGIMFFLILISVFILMLTVFLQLVYHSWCTVPLSVFLLSFSSVHLIRGY